MRAYKILLSLSLLVNLALGGWMLLGRETKERAEDLPYLSKRIFTENQNDILINFVPLREAMREYVGKQDGKLGVYFEYLPSGTSVGVNDQMEVRFASLVKVPVVMAVYKQIELGKLGLDQELTVAETDINPLFGELWKKGAGTKVTVREAVRLSLVESDNTATRVLFSALPTGAIDDVFDSLDIPKDKTVDVHVISPKNYTSLLRSLYLSSYLRKEHSNEILNILTQTKFSDRLAASVPLGVKVAHKIGVFDEPGKEKIFSDCGIIYFPNRPYALCVMAMGQEEEAREYMRRLSKMVYGYIVAVNGDAR